MTPAGKEAGMDGKGEGWAHFRLSGKQGSPEGGEVSKNGAEIIGNAEPSTDLR